MSHAARSHDAFETAQRIREQLDQHLEAAERCRAKLEAAEAKLEVALNAADTMRFLSSLNDNRLTPGERQTKAGLLSRWDRYARVS